MGPRPSTTGSTSGRRPTRPPDPPSPTRDDGARVNPTPPQPPSDDHPTPQPSTPLPQPRAHAHRLTGRLDGAADNPCPSYARPTQASLASRNSPPVAHGPPGRLGPTAPARPQVIQCTYDHSAPIFRCPLCQFSTAHFAELRKHRAQVHRGAVFQDQYAGACGCPATFPTRLQAATHSAACTAMTDTTPDCAPAGPACVPRNPADVPHVDSAPASAQTGPSPPSAIRCSVCNAPFLDQASLASHQAACPLRELLRAKRARSPNSSAVRTPPASPVSSRPPPRKNPRPDPWLLRFDGACRRNPGPGGAGAVLYAPTGASFWTMAQFEPDRSNTNNTAEYLALIGGLRGAAAHGVTHLRIEGDSQLVIEQVKGNYQCRDPRIRALRDQVLHALREIPRTSLHHIDRKANCTADRLANAALDRRATKIECERKEEPDHACWSPASRDPAPAPPPSTTPLSAPAPPRVAPPPSRESPDSDDDDMAIEDTQVLEEEADIAERDNGQVYPAIPAGPDAVPARRPPARLKSLDADELEQLRARVLDMAQRLTAQIDEASDWLTIEGYISSLTDRLYDLLGPHLVEQRANNSPARRPPAPEGSRRPPRRRISTHHKDARLQEALDDLEALVRSDPSAQKAIRKARRRVARIRAALESSKLRHRFATKEKDCVHEILADALGEKTSAGKCAIPATDLEEYFRAVNTPRVEFDFHSNEGAFFRTVLDQLPPPTSTAEVLTDAITSDEIEDQLAKVSKSSSPGLDGLSYRIYGLFRLQLLPAFHAIFNACRQHKRIPATWKVAMTTLLFKKGDPTRPANWRPICLQQAIYKLYSGIMARRFMEWMEQNNRFSSSQKGFRSFNGCNEHNFLGASLLDQARRSRKKLYIVWYDLKNAFGSLPQPYMWQVLRRLGVPEDFVQCAIDIYTDSYFMVESCDGLTDPIRQEIGVYQGCPLSPYLFIASLTPLMRALHSISDTGVPVAPNLRECVSAFADDLKIFADSADGIRKLHQVVTKFLRWTTMRANPDKCAFLPITTNNSNHVVDDLELRLDGEPIPKLTLQESYTYLGIGDGFDHVRQRTQLTAKLTQLKTQTLALLKTKLAPWQIIKAIKTYIYPQMDYLLRNTRPLRTQLQGFDRMLAKGLKNLLKLPQAATNEFFYAPTSAGGLGLLPLAELHDALQITNALQMLHSQDDNIRAIARTQVMAIVRKRYILIEDHWQDKTDEAVQLFLNGKLDDSPYATAKRRNGDIGSLWVDVRRHLKTHGLELSTMDGEPLQLKVPHTQKPLDFKTWARHVKLHLKIQHLAKWKAMTDQGRTVRSHGGLGSNFVTKGTLLWDADYIFAVKARLNQVDTRSVLKRKRLRNNANCRQRGCQQQETLAHVLNHCAGTMDSIRARHDTSLNKIKAAIEKAVTASNGRLTLRVNSTVPDFDGPTLKPDIQLYDALHKRAVISDLAVAFEDHPSDTTSNFDRIRDTKTTKYAPLKEFLERQGYSVSLSALIYGSLGSIAPSNYQVYTEHLGLLKRDTRRLEYQLSTDHIKASKRIWAGHAGQARRAEQVRQTEAAPTERPTRRSEGRQAQPQSTNQDRPARGAPRGSQDRPTQPSRRRRRRSKRKGSSNRRDTAAPSRNQ